MYKRQLQGGGSASAVLRNARRLGPQTLWRGLGATLVRDLPYTVLFWTSVAALRASVAPATAPHAKLRNMPLPLPPSSARSPRRS